MAKALLVISILILLVNNYTVIRGFLAKKSM